MIKAVRIFIEVMGWLIITGSVTLCAGMLYLFLFYTHWENDTVAFVVLISGFIAGAVLATKISIKYGTMEWLSNIRRIS
jgi:uncharacterized membrane protein YoaK (UPF0700 family)